MIRLEPRTPFLESPQPTPEPATAQPFLESPQPTPEPATAQPNPEPATAQPNPEPPSPIRGSVGSLDYGELSSDSPPLFLPEFPDYEFDLAGRATRVRCSSTRGPAARLGPVPLNANGQQSLRRWSGERVSLSPAAALRLLQLSPVPVGERFSLSGFSRYWFDETGQAYSVLTDRPLSYKLVRGHKRFRLKRDGRDNIVNVTDIGVRRMRDGRASYCSCEPPAGAKWMGAEFPDFAADLATGAPYRISSPRFFVVEPRPIALNNGRYWIHDFSGKRRSLSPEQILDIVRPNRDTPAEP